MVICDQPEAISIEAGLHQQNDYNLLNFQVTINIFLAIKYF